MIGAFDRWVAAGKTSYTDLAIFRIVYAVLALITLPRLDFVSKFPGSLYRPPPGPFRLMSGVPPHPVFVALQVMLMLSLACLVVGFHTRTASLSTGTLMMVALGFDYSFGKIDHTIFGVAVPLVLCWAGWGRRFSFDAIRNPIRQVDQELPPQWPLRLMALIVGLAFLTAALAKFSGGWLSTSSQAVRGYFLKRYVINGDADGVAPILMAIHSPRAWELLDWFTVAFEAAVLISVLVWPAFRVMLAVACVFHLSVLLMLDIAFSINVIAYGSFVYWSVICAPVRRLWGRPPPDMTRPVVRYALICGLFVAGVIIQFAPLVHPKFLLSAAIVVLGAVSAIVYLAMVAGRAVHRPKPT